MNDVLPTATLAKPPTHPDYSLTGRSAATAVQLGLAEADWYQSPVPRSTMRRLLERRDGPAIRDTLLWFMLLLASGTAGYAWRGSWWAVFPFALYGVLYASVSDSRWHEAGHGTAFKTDWMNNALYELASFMVLRESTVWRWSHTRHHSDTIIVGRDPEIAVPRPPDVRGIILSFFGIGGYRKYFRRVFAHAGGRMLADERTFIPAGEFPKIYRRARIYIAIYATVAGLALATHRVLPLLYVGLTNLYGSWLMVVYGLTQHAGLAENVLDHRLNCRTVRMNPIHRYLYWNMNYHVEHHMFPLVPYHALPRLHQLVRHDMPTPYPGLIAAYREIIPTVLRQVKDPAYHVKRKLPARGRSSAVDAGPPRAQQAPGASGWIDVCAAGDLGREEVLRFDHGKRTFALCRDGGGRVYATAGICTHGHAHLGEGYVKGDSIECPKHNGRFRLADGSPARAPACRALATFPIEEREGRLFLNPTRPGGAGARDPQTFRLRVMANENVATFIKELVFEPLDGMRIEFTPGDYLQFDIPAYEEIRFRDFAIPEPYATVWRNQHVFDLVAHNPAAGRRNNYSLASNPAAESTLRFNIRIATPPPGQDCPPGVGSAYMAALQPGDVVTAIGPMGDFHLKPTQREAVYIGGGAGMAPLRAHLSHLFETERTARRVSFWYGARSRQEIFYAEYFASLARAHPNFSFHVALSSPLPEDAWSGQTGFIHEVVVESYLRTHPNPRAVEYYLCGPPMMVKACNRMLAALGVAPDHIAYDEY